MSKDKSKGQDLTLTFTRRVSLVENCSEYFFQVPQSFHWQPGQYLKYTLEHSDVDDRGITRKFTIIPGANDQEVGLVARFYEDGSSFKRKLQALKTGDNVRAKGPAGDFTWPVNQKFVVLVVGGIGIAPYVSMLKDWAQAGARPAVQLIYANHSAEFMYKSFLDELVAKHPNLSIDYIVTSADGRLDANRIIELATVGDRQVSMVYVAGPKLMSKMIKNQFKQIYPAITLRTDSFSNYDQDA